MRCSACAHPSDGELCAACLEKVQRVKPATRSRVDSAAYHTRRLLAARTDLVELEDYLEAGRPAGRCW